jgi:hypothetical protein
MLLREEVILPGSSFKSKRPADTPGLNLRQAKWADINLERAEWRYFVSKTKTDHLVPLAKQAVRIFK